MRPRGEGEVQETPVIVHAPAATPTASAPVTPVPDPVNVDLEVKSPMIGTFYRRPSPDADTYSEIGKQVEPDTVVCNI